MPIYRYTLITQDAKGQTVHQILTTQVKLEVQDYDIRGITREAGIVFEIACPWDGKFALFQLEDGKPTRILDESRRNGCLEHGGPPLASELEVDMTSKA